MATKKPANGRFLGYVEAPDEKAAIAKAIKITNPEQQRRLIVQRIERGLTGGNT